MSYINSIQAICTSDGITYPGMKKSTGDVYCTLSRNNLGI